MPGPALTKAGAFNLPCRQFGLVKLGRSTHLYCSAPDNPAAECRLDAEREAALSRWGKVYEIEAVVPFDKAGMREVALRCPQADVTARNFPLTSEALRKKLGVKEGSGIHLFGARADVSNYQSFTSHQETEAIKAAISSRLARAERKSCHWARLRTQLCSGYCIL